MEIDRILNNDLQKSDPDIHIQFQHSIRAEYLWNRIISNHWNKSCNLQDRLINFYYQDSTIHLQNSNNHTLINELENNLNKSLSDWFFNIKSYQQFCINLSFDGKYYIEQEPKYKFWDINGKLPIEEDFIIFDILAKYSEKLKIHNHILQIELIEISKSLDWENYINVSKLF